MTETEFKSEGRLERVLRSGRFAVTAELNPPDSADPDEVYEAALVLSEVCDAINATDGSGANCEVFLAGLSILPEYVRFPGKIWFSRSCTNTCFKYYFPLKIRDLILVPYS